MSVLEQRIHKDMVDKDSNANMWTNSAIGLQRALNNNNNK